MDLSRKQKIRIKKKRLYSPCYIHFQIHGVEVLVQVCGIEFQQLWPNSSCCFGGACTFFLHGAYLPCGKFKRKFFCKQQNVWWWEQWLSRNGLNDLDSLMKANVMSTNKKLLLNKMYEIFGNISWRFIFFKNHKKMFFFLYIFNWDSLVFFTWICIIQSILYERFLMKCIHKKNCNLYINIYIYMYIYILGWVKGFTIFW